MSDIDDPDRDRRRLAVARDARARPGQRARSSTSTPCPVRVDGLGRVTEVGLLLRVAADGSISRMVVSGRVLFGERVRDALLRHLEKDLGPLALPRLPADPTPFTIVEYFPDPDRSGFHDPRHHAVSLAYVVPVDGDCQPTQEALDLAWFTPAEAVSDVGARADDRRPRPPAPPRPRPRRRAARERPSRPAIGHPPTGRATPRTVGVRCRRATPSTAPRPRCARRSSTRRWCASTPPGWSASRPGPGASIERVESHGKHLEIAVGRRRHPAHPHAHERVVAPLPPRRELAAAAPPDAGADRGRRAGPRCASTPRSSRPTARPTPAATPGSAGSVRTSAAPTPTSAGASSCCWPTTIRERQPGRGAARPAGVLRRRQRLPLRGAVGRRAEPVRPRSATCPRPTPCASSTSPPSCCGPTCTARRADHRPRRQGRPRRVRPQRAALPALRARRSRPAATGEHARVLYWCPGCQVRLDPRRGAPRRHAVDRRRPIRHPRRRAKFLADLPWRRTGVTRPTDAADRRSRPDRGSYSVAIASRTFMFDALYDGYRAATKPATTAPTRMTTMISGRERELVDDRVGHGQRQGDADQRADDDADDGAERRHDDRLPAHRCGGSGACSSRPPASGRSPGSARTRRAPA